MIRPIYRCIVAAMVLAACAACMKLGPGASADTRYYLLEPATAADASPPVAALAPDAVIGIGPVSLPAYLDRPQIVTRLGDNQIRVDEFHRWGEPLKDAVLRVLTEDVSRLAGGGRVLAFPWKRSRKVSVQVAVTVVNFEADDQGGVTLHARWQLLGGGGEPLGKHQAELSRAAGGDYGQMVGAMSGLLSELAAQIFRTASEAVHQ